MPLDINDLRADKGGDPEKVRVSEQRRYAKEDTVGKVLELDEEWRRLRTDINEQQKAKGKMSKDIGQRRKKGEDTSADQERVKEISKAIAEMQKRIGEVEQEVQRALSVIGNYVHESVPVHDDEAHNEVVTTWGTPTKPTCTLRHHHELLHMIGGYESERGSRVAGHRAYFLTGPGVLLNQALQQYALAYLTARAYTPVQPPYFMNKDVMAGVAQLSEFNEALYHVSGDSGDMEKYLIATSEQPLCGFHRGDWFQSTDLPKRYAGISTCFRKEAGKSGQDVWGVFRVHQFDKIEQFCITDPESSWAMHEEMRVLAEEFYKTLELPFRVVNIVSAELNNAAAKKYDLEAWFPGYDAYRELVSCSNCTDYQARAMGIRYGQAKDKSDKTARAEHVHMLNSTLCAASRTMCCVLENYQEEDGVRVPKALVPFMGGLTFLPFVREAPVNEEDRKAAKAKARAQSKKQKAPKAKAAKKAAEAAGAGAGAGAAEAVVAPTGEAAGTAV